MSTLVVGSLSSIEDGSVVRISELASIARKISFVETISSLKSLDKDLFKSVFVEGYYSKGDGGGGVYFQDEADTLSPDNGGTIIVSNDSARWKLSHNGEVSVRQFGAKADGVTDDSYAFSSLAADTAVKVGVVPGSAAGYKLASTVTINRNGFKLRGEYFSKLIQSPGQRCFKIIGNLIEVSGFAIDGTQVTSQMAPILIGTDVSSMTNIIVKDMYGTNCYGFITDGASPSNRANFLTFSNITLAGHRGYGVDTSDCWASYFMRNITVDRVGASGTDYNFPGFRVNDAEGVFMMDCAHNGSAYTSIQSGQDGALFNNSGFVVIDNFLPDHASGYGIRISGCTNVKISNCSIPNAVMGGLLMGNCQTVSVHNVSLGAFSSADSNSNGISMTLCNDISMSNVESFLWKQNGIILDGCNRFRVANSAFRNNSNLGVVTLTSSGTSVVGIIHGCMTAFNTAGNIDIKGTNIYVRDSVAQNGSIMDGASPFSA